MSGFDFGKLIQSLVLLAVVFLFTSTNELKDSIYALNVQLKDSIHELNGSIALLNREKEINNNRLDKINNELTGIANTSANNEVSMSLIKYRLDSMENRK